MYHSGGAIYRLCTLFPLWSWLFLPKPFQPSFLCQKRQGHGYSSSLFDRHFQQCTILCWCAFLIPWIRCGWDKEFKKNIFSLNYFITFYYVFRAETRAHFSISSCEGTDFLQYNGRVWSMEGMKRETKMDWSGWSFTQGGGVRCDFGWLDERFRDVNYGHRREDRLRHEDGDGREVKGGWEGGLGIH